MNEFLFLAQEETAPALEMGLRVPLSTMHFLEFAIWGAWWVVLGNYLNTLKFERKDIGRIYATMAVGSIIAPLFVGMVADRYFNSENVLAVSHLIGGVLLLLLARIRTPRAFYWTAFAYALVYAPTIALVNAVVFANVPDAGRDFGGIRVLGTIGWILAGWSLKYFLKPGQPVTNRPILLAAGLSFVLGVFSFFLPDTPPNPESEIPFADALRLFEDPSFALFFAISFLIGMALSFYFSFTALFLEQDQKIKAPNIGPLMSVGQCFEIIFLVSLAWFLKEWGMKYVLSLGLLAWALRYALFAVARPFALILIGIALHGICFDFFFAAGFIHVEQTAPEGIRASAQSLFSVIVYGLGMYFGTEASGWVNQYFTREEVDPATGATVRHTDWRKFWLVPCIGATIAFVLFVIFGDA